jgi:hypothetical protein
LPTPARAARAARTALVLATTLPQRPRYRP